MPGLQESRKRQVITCYENQHCATSPSLKCYIDNAVVMVMNKKEQ